MSIGKAILAGLAGAGRGAAKLALLEDEERRETSKMTYKTGVAMAEKFGELRQQSREEIIKENEAVNQLKNYVVDGQPLGAANARAVVRKAEVLGIDNPLDVLEQYSVSGDAKVTVQAPTKKQVIPEGLDLEEGDSGIFARGRTKSVVEDAEKLLTASGIDLEYTIPKRPEVDTSGMTFTKRVEEDFDTSTKSMYLYQGDRPPRQVQTITYYDKNDPNRAPKTVIQDVLTGKPLEIDPTDPNIQLLGTLKEGDGSDRGPVLVATKDGFVDYKIGGVPQIGIREGNIVYAQNPDGTKGEIIPNAIIVGARDVRSGQDVRTIKENSKLPQFKIFQEKFQDLTALQEQAVVLDERIGYMMEKNRQIGDAGYSAGGFFTTAVNTGIKAVSSSAAFLNDLATSDRFQGTSEEAETARYNYVESNESTLRELVSAGETLVEGLDEVQARAVRMQQLQAEAILLAYDLAKATGDTRISNQDFDAFIKTVKGNSVESTHKLLVRAGERVLSRYSAMYDNVANTYLPAAKAVAEGDDVDASTTASLNFYTEQLDVGGRFDPEILSTQFKRTAEQFSPEPIIPEQPKAGTDFTSERVEIDDGEEVLRITFKDGTSLDLSNPKYLDATPEEIQEALSKLRSVKQ